MKKLKTAIIGMGKMGKIRYDSLSQSEKFDIVGVCDVNVDNLTRYNNVFSDWKECINTTHPEAVFVCTVNAVIPEVVCYSLHKKIHVFAEKPPGRSLADAVKMKNAAEESGMILKFGFNHRYHNSIIEANVLIKNGLLGEPLAARGVYGKAGNLSFSNEWRNKPNISGGGILIDQGIHMIDLLCYFFGDLEPISSDVKTLAWHDINTEDSVFAMLRNDDGKVVSVHSSALQWKHKFDLDIMCEDGYLSLNGLLTPTRSYGQEKITYYRKDLELKSGIIGNPKEHTMSFDSDESWHLEANEFYNAVVHGVPLENGTPKDAVRVMKIIEKIYQLGGFEHQC